VLLQHYLSGVSSHYPEHGDATLLETFQIFTKLQDVTNQQAINFNAVTMTPSNLANS